jgi:hypothetical protein
MTKNITLHHRRVTKTLLFLFFFAFLFSGCARMVRTEQPSVGDMVSLSAGQTVGQTFVAKYDGLTGIFFYFSLSQMSGDGEMRLHLRTGPDAVSDLAVSINTISIDQLQEPGYYGFLFPAQTSSNQKYYYAYIDFAGEGKLEVGKAAGDTYLNGALYQGGVPQDAQTAFQLKYSPRYVLFGLGIEVLTWIGYLFVGLFLFVMPGWGLFSLLWPSWGKFAWPEKLGLSAGLSLAVYPLLLVWTDLIGLHLGAIYAWFPPIAGLGMILWKNRKRIQTPVGPRGSLLHVKSMDVIKALPDLLFVLIAVLIFFTRFWAIRSIEAPLWADSVQHTAIAQLLVDHGGLFTSWLPYAPYQSLTVQFGFPVFAALLTWLTGFGSDKAVLVSGQLVNFFAIITILPLAVRLAGGNRWAGLGAIIVAGLLSPIPAFFVNWGRYAQLAGQAIFPVAAWLGWAMLSGTFGLPFFQRIAGSSRRLAIIFSVISLAGMILCYYRTAFYFVAFILVVLVAVGFSEWHFNGRTWAGKLGTLVVAAVTAGIFLTPWALRLSGSVLANDIEVGITGSSSLTQIWNDLLLWKTIFFYVPGPLMVAGAAGILWSLFRKRWMVAGQALWIILLVTFVIAQLIRIPGANMMDNFTIMIATYIPISLIIGWLVSDIAGNGNQSLRQFILATALILLAGYGALVPQRSIVQPSVYTYVTRPDTLASAWIREHIPKDSLFFVEGVMYKWHSILGSDAGWWLPLLTERQNTIPPQYALLNEVPVQPDYTQRMISMVESMQTAPLDSLQSFSILCEEGVTYVYVGQLQGWAALKMLGAPQLFSPTVLLNSPYYSVAYHQDRVYVFSLNRGYCP